MNETTNIIASDEVIKNSKLWSCYRVSRHGGHVTYEDEKILDEENLFQMKAELDDSETDVFDAFNRKPAKSELIIEEVDTGLGALMFTSQRYIDRMDVLIEDDELRDAVLFIMGLELEEVEEALYSEKFA